MRPLVLAVLVGACAYNSLVAAPQRADGGVITLKPFDRTTRGNLQRLRDFLWTHWLNRERATIKVIGYSIEGMESDTVYIVAPDEAGRWCISSDSRHQVIDYPHDRFSYRTSHASATSVHRVRRHGTSWLVMKDSAGKIVDEL